MTITSPSAKDARMQVRDTESINKRNATITPNSMAKDLNSLQRSWKSRSSRKRTMIRKARELRK